MHGRLSWMSGPRSFHKPSLSRHRTVTAFIQHALCISENSEIPEKKIAYFNILEASPRPFTKVLRQCVRDPFQLLLQ